MRASLTSGLLLQALLATASPILDREEPRSGMKFRARAPVPFQEPSPDVISERMLPLRRIPRRQTQRDTGSQALARSFQRSVTSPICSGSSAKKQTVAEAVLKPVMGDSEMGTEIQLGNQTFVVVVDSGSSDLWVVAEDYECVTGNLTVTSQDVCNVTTRFQGTFSGGEIEDRHLDIEYGSGQVVVGPMGYQEVTLAGLTVEKQQMSLANFVNFQAQGTVSGLLGLAYPELTSAFEGNETEVANDNFNTTLRPYDNMLTNIFAQNLTAPVFSLALDSLTGGLLAIGGLPANVSHGPAFSSTPILIADINNSHVAGRSTNFTFYTIIPDDFVYGPPGSGPSSSSSSTRRDDRTSGLKSTRDIPIPPTAWTRMAEPHLPGLRSRGLTTAKNTVPMIVDSGTTLTNLPDAIVQALYDQFETKPQATTATQGQFYVPCASKLPAFGVVIGGQTFFVPDEALVIQENKMAGDLCLIGVQPAFGPSASLILGATWLNGVVAVFDIGAAEMRFAPRS